MNEKFFIYKKSYSTDEKPDLSFIPMMTRRKLSPLVKSAFSTMYDCYDGKDINLVFASQYGELDILNKLISQYSQDNEVSPIAFSSSVHNSTAGIFSLLNNIKHKYNAISAGEHSLSNGLSAALTETDTVLFCYADTFPHPASVSCLIGKTAAPDADEIILELRQNTGVKNELEEFIKFLNNEKDSFDAPFYTLRRVK